MSVGKNENHQGAVMSEADKFDMFYGGFVLGGKDKRSAVCHAGKCSAHAVEHATDIAGVIAKRGVDLFAVVIVEIANLEQPVHEHAQPQLGRDTARRDMRAVQKA